MSNESTDDSVDGGQGGADQPQDGQPEAGQAAGAAGQPAYRTGPGVGDIFSIPETVNEMKIGILLNVLIAIGIGFVALGLSTQSGGGVGGFFGAGGIGTMSGLILTPLVGAVIGLRQAATIDDQPGNVLYANAVVTTLVGTFLLMLIAMVLSLLIAGSSNLGQALGNAILPFLIGAIGAALVAAGAVWADVNVVPGPSQPASPQQGQGQPR